MQRPIVIIGAGGHGREVLDAVVASRPAGEPAFAGFLDDRPDRSHDVIGPVEPGVVPDGAAVIVAIGTSEVRYEIVRRFPVDTSWATVVHPSAVVSSSAVLGPGVYVAPLAYVGPDARVGPHTVVNVQAQVAHDVVVGEFVTLSPSVTVNGHARLGHGCFLGTAASIGVQVSVGDWTRVAAGARVTTNCENGWLLFGNPATGRRRYEAPPGAEALGAVSGENSPPAASGEGSGR